ncbi:TNF receptor-associated factor 5 isoform X2 [Pygocentrus nattereri]|uniref:TNF receptor-associated factor 5 isoform X2 n=1 Tax=Pygocentrus nattereri TaxID=42514 RepID=UPI000814896E|nr:TNF receptor-associated factor 5 isoform X2 [Pygocentrus nattereri]
MAAEENECPKFQLSQQGSDHVRSWELESVLAGRKLSFVARLDDQYVCPACGGVVLNPHQTGCGHIFCAKCIRIFIENGDTSKCPFDGILIKAEEVFQDNCCKREVLNLEVYCTNSPACTQKVTLCNLQDHLKACQHEALQCSNPGCTDILLRKNLTDHQRSLCSFRTEYCRYCKKPYPVTQLPDHEKTSCPEAEVQCPNKCSHMVKRHKVKHDYIFKVFHSVLSLTVAFLFKCNTVEVICLFSISIFLAPLSFLPAICHLQLKDHSDECQEVETDCIYKKYGCTVRDKRGQVKVHEYTEFSHHVLLVLDSNNKLMEQVDQLQQDLAVQQGELKERNLLVSNLNREVSKCDSTLSAIQGSVEEQREHVSSVKRELQDLRGVLEAELAKEELAALRASLDSLRQQVAVTQSLREHLGALGQTCQRHTRLLDIHVEQLQCNEQRFRQLESTSYDGKLIWKVHDYHRKKEAGTSLNSPPFYTSRSGYKLSARVYPGGEGAARGTHLSLYVMLMRGDFDSLLPWPFRQNVTLTVLDQSGSRNHINCSFTPDTASENFRRPTSENNSALGFPRFLSHGELEAPRNAVYVRDDTLFIKVKVDTTGLEDL